MPSRQTLHNRAQSVARLQRAAGDGLRVSYETTDFRPGFMIRTAGGAEVFGPVRYENAMAFLLGFHYGVTETIRPCPLFHPDHNGECTHCDEWADAHTPEAIAAGEALAAAKK